jgi:hypothetical protein
MVKSLFDLTDWNIWTQIIFYDTPESFYAISKAGFESLIFFQWILMCFWFRLTTRSLWACIIFWTVGNKLLRKEIRIGFQETFILF